MEDAMTSAFRKIQAEYVIVLMNAGKCWSTGKLVHVSDKSHLTKRGGTKSIARN